MDFVWDSGNTEHIAPHGITREEAEQVLQNDPFDVASQYRNGEHRTSHIGETDAGRVLVVAITLRNNRTRVVIAFPANRQMRKFYQHQKEANDAQSARSPRLQE